jgi:hypothetical protein
MGLHALKLTGNNSGNLLFTQAAHTQTTNPYHLGFEFSKKISEVNETFSSVLIPAANWIIPSPDFGFLASQLKQISIPLCCVGLGSQISASQINTIPRGTLDFLKVLSAQSRFIGLRGSKTEEILRILGIQNGVACGCPSIFPSFALPPAWATFRTNSSTRLSISFTRFGRTDLDREGHQKHLAELAGRFGHSIILQSEADEISYLHNPDTEVGHWLCEYYNISHSELPSLVAKMHFFKSQQSWIAFHRENTDLTISSRIHGCIASLLAGKPAILLAHDQRTNELAETMGIPHLPIGKIQEIHSREDLMQLSDLLNESHFREKQVENLEKLKFVYKACGVATSV